MKKFLFTLVIGMCAGAWGYSQYGTQATDIVTTAQAKAESLRK